MVTKRRKGTSASEAIDLQEAINDLCQEHFMFYLYLCFTPPKVLEDGREAFCRYWYVFKERTEVSEAIAGLEEKGYVRCQYSEDGFTQIKISVLKHLAIPVNENLAFFHQTKTRSSEPLHDLIVDPFEDPREVLSKRVKPGKKTKVFKETISVNKYTSPGDEKNINPEPLSSSGKVKTLSEILRSFSLKTEEHLSQKLIPINVKDYSDRLIKKVFMDPESIIIINSKNLSEDFSEKDFGNKKTIFFDFLKKFFCLQSFVLLTEGKHKGLKTRPVLDLANNNNKKNNKSMNNYKNFNFNDRFRAKQNRQLVSKTQQRRQRRDKTDKTMNTKRQSSSSSGDVDERQTTTNNNDIYSSKSRCVSCLPCDDIDIEHCPKEVFETKSSTAGSEGLDKPQNLGKVLPSVARKKAKRGSKLNLEKIKTRYVQERKARATEQKEKKKRKNLSEQDVWDHIKNKNLDLFSPQVDREKILKILALPKKSITRKELIENLGNSFSNIYFAYRQKISEASGVKSIYTKDFGKNFEYAKKAAEACIVCGVTPQFVIQHFHEVRSRFAQNLSYIPLSILSNASMIDSAASAYIGKQETVEFGNSYAETDKLHPLLRKKLEKAGFDTQEYSDNFLMTIQVNAIDIAEGYEMFISSDIKEMVYWAAKNVFGGKAS